MDTPIIKQIMQNKTLSMNQKMAAFLLHCPPHQLPQSNKEDFLTLGRTIKRMVDDGFLLIEGLNNDGSLKYKCEKQWCFVN